MIEQKSLIINADNKTWEIITLKDEDIIGPMDYGLKLYEEGKSFVLLGQGLLAGSSIPGTHRMTIVGYSPQWDHFYQSTMGGATYVMLNLGVNYIVITGKLSNEHVLILNHTKGSLEVSFAPVDVQAVWAGYKEEIGFYALQEYIYDTYGKEFKDCRVIASGPAALRTRSGALGSAPIEKGKITPVDCWAGRGGFGSQLLQNHGVAGIIYGGDEHILNPYASQKEKIEKIFKEEFNTTVIGEDIIATKKYRYDDKFHSGGTFGVNYTKIGGELFCFNYDSVRWTEEERLDIHKRFILDHYLKQFNEETIEPKLFKHCGEPCPAVCKKMRGVYKKDYEPYQTLGPNSGIFDQRAAELANHHADAMGFDAIEIGITCSWLLDCMASGLIPKEDLGVTLEPKFTPQGFDVVHDSMTNAKICVELMNTFVSEKHPVFHKGLRVAAKSLAEKYGRSEILHKATYNSHGNDGCMVPNQYWTPGMYSPMPLMGKYCTSYGVGGIPPEEVGKKNVERMVVELYSDNGGLCRFHRTWIEKVFPRLINELYDQDIDMLEHHKQLSKQINKVNNAVFWETETVVDIIHGFHRRWSKILYNDENLKLWLAKFEADKWSAAEEYWNTIHNAQKQSFEEL